MDESITTNMKMWVIQKAHTQVRYMYIPVCLITQPNTFCVKYLKWWRTCEV